MSAEPLATFPSPGQRLSYEDWLSAPETNQRVEVVDGEVMIYSPHRGYQDMVLGLALHLRASTPEGYRVMVAPFDWLLRTDPLLVRQPDVMVVRAGQNSTDAHETTAPLLAAEVLSPSTATTDLIRKRREYAAAGLEHYLVAEPAEPALAYYRLVEGALHEVRQMSSEPLTLAAPFSVRLVPAELA